MADTVLESFLIKLGYQIDQASQKSFVSAIGEGIQGVTKFATALMAMAVGVEEAVRRTASQMARLEHQAQMSGQASDKLKAWGTAIEGIGGSYSGLINAQEKLNQELVKSPWLQSWAQQAIGNHEVSMKGIIERYHELSQAYGESGAATLQFRREMEEVLHVDMSMAMLADKNYDKWQQLQRQAEAEAVTFHKRWQQYSKNALDLQADWSAFTNTIETYYKTALGGLTGYLDQSISQVESFLVAHEADFTKWMDDLEKKFTEHNWEDVGRQIGEAIGRGLDWLVQQAPKWFESGMEIGQKMAEGLVEGLIKGIVGADIYEKIKGVIEPTVHATTAIPRAVFDPVGTYMGAQKWLGGKINEYIPHFQGGGVVNANLHHGEMVLPSNISSGLQQFFGGGGGGEGALDDLGHWLNGDTSFTPFILFAEEVYDKLTDVFEESLLRVFPGGGASARSAAMGGGGDGGGDGGGAGAGGGAGSVPGGAAAGSSSSSTDGKPTSGANEFPNQTFAESRKRFAEELNSNPALREKLMNIAATEQSDPTGNLSVIETMMNRAELRGTSLAAQVKRTFEGGYYAGKDNPAQMAAMRKTIEANLAKALAGSNVSNYATDNASAGLARSDLQSGKYTYASSYGGETFFTPGTGVPRDRARFPAWRQAHMAGDQPQEAQTGAQTPQGLPGDALGGGGGAVGNTVDQMIALSGHRGAAVREFLRNPKGVIERDPDLGLWCAEFTNAYLQHSGIPHPKSLMARAYASWGYAIAAKNLRKGDVLLNLNRAHVGVATGRTWLNTPGHKPGEVEEVSSNTIGPHGELLNIPGTRWRSDVEVRRSAELAQAQEQNMQLAAKRDTDAKKDEIKYGVGGALSHSVDNSTNTTVINGVTDPHGVGRVVSDLGNRNSTFQMRNSRTYVR